MQAEDMYGVVIPDEDADGFESIQVNVKKKIIIKKLYFIVCFINTSCETEVLASERRSIMK